MPSLYHLLPLLHKRSLDPALGLSLPFGLPAEIAFGAPLVALAFALIAGATWRFGVRHYQSTGS